MPSAGRPGLGADIERQRTVIIRLLTFFLALIWCLPLLAAQTDYAKRIAPLIDPAKLATLGKGGANNDPSRLSVQEVPGLEQQFPPPDQRHAAVEIEIDR